MPPTPPTLARQPRKHELHAFSQTPFVEINNTKKGNIVVGCLYKHPSMDLLDFKSNYLSQIFEILTKE